MEGRRETARAKKFKNSPLERCLCGIAATLLFVAASILLLRSKFFRKHWGSYYIVCLIASNIIQLVMLSVFVGLSFSNKWNWLVNYKLIQKKRSASAKLLVEASVSGFVAWIYFQIGMDVNPVLIVSAGLFSLYFMCLSGVLFVGFSFAPVCIFADFCFCLGFSKGFNTTEFWVGIPFGFSIFIVKKLVEYSDFKRKAAEKKKRSAQQENPSEEMGSLHQV